jgi:hypothetical protein
MVLLRCDLIPGADADAQDIDCSWGELALKQQRGDFGVITKAAAEEGDTLAMLDRNCITEEFTRRVFVVLDDGYAFVFDEMGSPIDEPSNFVVNGRQQLLDEDGGHGFFDEWTGDDSGYYILGVPPEGVGLPPTAAPAPARALAPAPASASDIMVVNKRITKCFKSSEDDTVGTWYGGLVLAVNPGIGCLIAFDDGDMHESSIQEMVGLQEMRKLQLMQDERGLVDDNWQATKALGASLLKVGGEYAPVGVLLGGGRLALCKETIFTEHHLSLSQLEAHISAKVQRPTRGAGGAGDDKRGGLGSFRFGDCVISTGSAGTEEVIFGVMSFFHRKQQNRYLITFDAQLEEFTVGPWTAWRRIPADGIDVSTFDADDSSKVKLCQTPWLTCTSPLPPCLPSGQVG